MLEKYLNKEVIIEEKLFNLSSTISRSGMAKMTLGTQNQISGLLTAMDDEFVELDNNILVARKYIYRIILK